MSMYDSVSSLVYKLEQQVKVKAPGGPTYPCVKSIRGSGTLLISDVTEFRYPDLAKCEH